MDETMKTIVTVVAGVLGGGFGMKLLDFIRAWWERKSKREEAKTKQDEVNDAAAIAAELTVNERLLARIDRVEARMDSERDAHQEEIKSYGAKVKELERKNEECETRYTRLEHENVERVQREKELIDAKRLLLYSYENLRSDLSSLRRHVDRVEDENKRLREVIEHGVGTKG